MSDLPKGAVVQHRATRQRMVALQSQDTPQGKMVHCDTGAGICVFPRESLQLLEAPDSSDIARRVNELERRITDLEQAESRLDRVYGN